MDVLIERIGSHGDGVATAPSGVVVFVPLTLPAERARVAVVSDRGRLLSVAAASPDRIEAPCSYFGLCGGCALQHWRSEPYLKWKTDQVVLALARERIEAPVAVPFIAGPGERRRVSLHARRGSGRTVLGFKSRRSWSVVDIDACEVADRRIVAAIPQLRRLAAPFLEHPKSAPILHVTITETGLAVDVSGVEAKGGGLSADARAQVAQVAQTSDLARVTLAGEMIYLARPPLVRFGGAVIVLPPGGFLQAVARAESAMAQVAAEALEGMEKVVDLFCGSGAFALRLGRRASVLALDASAEAIGALHGGRASTGDLKSVDAIVRDLFRRPLLASEMKGFKGVVIDPPRAGAYHQALELARSSVETVVSVSCNPTTFARDASVLIGGGFRLEQVTPVDQFLWSPHMEVVGVFRR